MIEVNTSPTIVQDVQSVQPTMQQTNQPQPRSHSLLFWIIIAVFLLIGGAMLWYIFLGGHGGGNASVPSAITPTSFVPSPTPKITDLAPLLAANLKTVVLIQNSDSSYEKVIVPTVQVATYLKSLPAGEKFVSQSPDK